jgi:hypothetical protein
MNSENDDDLFDAIEKKYEIIGKEKGTSCEVEVMNALMSLIPEAYENVPGFIANLTCDMDLLDDEIEAVKQLETRDTEKYECLRGFLANTLAELDTQQLQVLANA